MSNNRSSSSGTRATRASLVADDVRNRIMSGAIAPRERLRVQDLAKRYEVALSPVREALNRLWSERLVEAHDMRGFFVAPVSAADLEELTRTRRWLNETALRESMRAGGESWQEAVLLAAHRLLRLSRSTGGEPNPAWNEAHRAFHRALTEGCGSRYLVGYCDALFVQAERYRNLSRQAPGADSARRDDEHRGILEAVLSGDADGAVALLGDHFESTAALCRTVLPGPGEGEAA